MREPIQVLIVDDSATVRFALTKVLEADGDIRVAATAGDPYIAKARLAEQVPDVIVLDVEMPRMDGLTFLDKLMSQHPIPTIVCSTLALEGSDVAFEAIRLGALEVVAKPPLGASGYFEAHAKELRELVRTAATQPRGRLLRAATPARAAASAPRRRLESMKTSDKVIVVGASTGGTEAVARFVASLPADAPGVVIVQHMPQNFTRRFAERLDGLGEVHVREAADGDAVLRGHVLIAPGGLHTALDRSGARYLVRVRDGDPVSRHKPSVDVLFRSAVRAAGVNTVAVIMTGMGDDGARGMLELKEAGAATLAQDEATCVVYGMPKEAVKLGAVTQQLPLGELAEAAVKLAA